MGDGVPRGGSGEGPLSSWLMGGHHLQCAHMYFLGDVCVESGQEIEEAAFWCLFLVVYQSHLEDAFFMTSSKPNYLSETTSQDIFTLGLQHNDFYGLP